MYGTMINSARIWDGTLRERRDFLLNCLSLTSLVITALPKGEININSISCKGIECLFLSAMVHFEGEK